MPQLDSGDDNVEYYTGIRYSTSNSYNPYWFNHLQASQSSVEEGKSAEYNNTATDTDMVKEEQNILQPPRGGEAPTKIDVAAVVFVITGTTQQAPQTVNLRASWRNLKTTPLIILEQTMWPIFIDCSRIFPTTSNYSMAPTSPRLYKNVSSNYYHPCCPTAQNRPHHQGHYPSDFNQGVFVEGGPYKNDSLEGQEQR